MSLREGLDTTILKYYAYQATAIEGFVTPIIIEYFLSNGVTYTEVGVLGGVFMASWVTSEIPTGYVGDRLGRRNSLVVGGLTVVLSLAALSVAETFLAFAIAYIIWPVGITFRSGTESAWLYDVLDDRLEASTFTKVKGRGEAIWYLSTAITSVVGAQLANFDWQYPFLANAVVVVVSVLVVVTFPQNETYEEGDGRFTLRDAIDGVRTQLGHPTILSFVVFTAIVFGFYNVASTFTQPVATDVGLSVSQLGWLYAAFYVLSAVASSSVTLVEKYVGVRTWFYGLPFTIALGFLIAYLIPVVVLPVFALLKVANSITMPLKHQYLNDQLESMGRATVLSSASMVAALAAVAFRVAGGVLADLTSPLSMLVLLAVVLAVGSAVILVAEPPVGDDAGSLDVVETSGSSKSDS